MTGRNFDRHIILFIICLTVVAALVRFPVSFGADDSPEPVAPSPCGSFPEESVRLDSLRTLFADLRVVKNCKVDEAGSRGKVDLVVSNLNDKTDLLGKDWKTLIRCYRSGHCEIADKVNDVTFRFRTESLEGVEYATLPLHVLHALAELRR